MKYAALFDTASIQQYVFGSSKLKENLGASYNIENIYKVFENETNIANVKFEKGFIGGGNALIFFENEDNCKEAVKSFTREILVKYPGVTVVVASGELDKDSPNFRVGLNDLFSQLQKNKSAYLQQTIPPSFGFFAEDITNGFAANMAYEVDKNDQRYVSAVTASKLLSIEESKKKYDSILRKVLSNNKYELPTDLEDLGRVEGSSHIAIVHIDGNSMGRRFIEQENLPKIKELSKSVTKKVQEAFNYLIEQMPEITDNLCKELNIVNKHKLFIRPIIIGGDDITFITNGKIGVYLAKLFIEKLQEGELSDGKPLYACAGVAITNYKYPFYRGYQIAEELCSIAKAKSRELKEKTDNKQKSWLDFHVVFGGISDSVSEIRETQYNNDITKAGDKTFIQRPFGIKTNTKFDMDKYLEPMKTFSEKDSQGKKKFPRNKIKELRSAIIKGKDECEKFTHHLNAIDLNLPSLGDEFKNNQIVNGGTPYFDMIELLDFYPEFELMKGEK